MRWNTVVGRRGDLAELAKVQHSKRPEVEGRRETKRQRKSEMKMERRVGPKGRK